MHFLSFSLPLAGVEQWILGLWVECSTTVLLGLNLYYKTFLPFSLSRSQCYKTLINCHSTVTPTFYVIKQYYDGNYHGLAVANTMVIYHGISTLEITGIFKTSTVYYRGI